MSGGAVLAAQRSRVALGSRTHKKEVGKAVAPGEYFVNNEGRVQRNAQGV